MADLPNGTEYTNLFDQYKLNAIKVTFRPRYDNFSGNDTVDTVLPGITNQQGTMLHIIKDPRDTTGPSGTYTSANFNTFCEKGGVRSYQGIKPVTVYFKPMINQTIEGQNINRVPPKWINTNDYTAGTPVVYNGFHAFATDFNFNGSFGQGFDVFVTYYMTFKNMK